MSTRLLSRFREKSVFGYTRPELCRRPIVGLIFVYKISPSIIILSSAVVTRIFRDSILRQRSPRIIRQQKNRRSLFATLQSRFIKDRSSKKLTSEHTFYVISF